MSSAQEPTLLTPNIVPESATGLSSGQTGKLPLLQFKNVISDELRGLTFDLYPKEILGFSGLIGSGQEQIPYILAGAIRAQSGTITCGESTTSLTSYTPRSAIDSGIGMVPADRAVEGLIAGFSVLKNITLPWIKSFSRLARIKADDERQFVTGQIHALNIVPPDGTRDVQLLSGGNAQKVVLAKWLNEAIRIIVLAEPTAGVDIVTRPFIYSLLRQRAAQGLAVIVCSTDVAELVEVCTRIIVLKGGRAVDELVGKTITEERVLHASMD
jgi:ribose transport system ATP-binding protein